MEKFLKKNSLDKINKFMNNKEKGGAKLEKRKKLENLEKKLKNSRLQYLNEIPAKGDDIKSGLTLMDCCLDEEQPLNLLVKIKIKPIENQRKILCSQEIIEKIKNFNNNHNDGDKVKYWNEAVIVADNKLDSTFFSKDIDGIIGFGQQSLLMWKSANLIKVTDKLEIEKKYYEHTLDVMTYLKHGFRCKIITANEQQILDTVGFIYDALVFYGKRKVACPEKKRNASPMKVDKFLKDVSEDIQSFVSRNKEQPEPKSSEYQPQNKRARIEPSKVNEKEFIVSPELYKILQSSFFRCTAEALTLVAMLCEPKELEEILKQKGEGVYKNIRSDHVKLILIYNDWKNKNYSENYTKCLNSARNSVNKIKAFDDFMKRCDQRKEKLMEHMKKEMSMFMEISCEGKYRDYSHLYKALAIANFEKAARWMKNENGENVYINMADKKIVHIHPGSILYGRQPGKEPEFVIYQKLICRDGKMCMYIISEVKKEWLSRRCETAEVSKPPPKTKLDKKFFTFAISSNQGDLKVNFLSARLCA